MQGIDVHGDKGKVGWVLVKSDGFDFAWVKATEAATWVDDRLWENLTGAKEAGLSVGAYHFARPDRHPALVEAKHFLEVYKPSVGDLLPVLDFETAPADGKWALEWLRYVEVAIGQPPILYTYPSFFSQLSVRLNPAMRLALRKYLLWFARYPLHDTGDRVHRIDPKPPLGEKLAVHQFSSEGHVLGVGSRTDMDQLYVPLQQITYGPPKDDTKIAERKAVLRKWILDQVESGRSWASIKLTANWREFKRLGGS